MTDEHSVPTEQEVQDEVSSLTNGIPERDLTDKEIEALADMVIVFVQKMTGMELFPYQYEFGWRIVYSLLVEDSEEITALFARQTGKCLAPGTEVLMFDGTLKKVEDVLVGDLLMGDDSTPRTVQSLAHGESPMYRIVPNGNAAEEYVVNSEHILSVKRRYDGEIVDVPIRKLLRLKKPDSSVMGYQVAVEYPEKVLPLDPYWVGLWLGDGTSRDVAITAADPEIVEYLHWLAETLGLRVSKYTEKGECDSWAIVGDGSEGCNPFRNYLNSAGILGGGKKQIPQEYLTSSRDQRLQLLAGIIDSDGSSSQDNCVEITQKKYSLAQSILRLCRSLGFRATLRPKLVQGKEYYRVWFYGRIWEIPTKLPRKQFSVKPLRENPQTYGFTIRPEGVGKYYGFVLDGNRRFVLSDHTVTHNTETVASIVVACMVLLPVFARSLPHDSRISKFKKGMWVGIYAPNYEQAGIMWSRMKARMYSHESRSALLDPDIDIDLTKVSTNMVLPNGSFCDSGTASPQASIEGKTYHLIILEETQDIPTSKIKECLAGDTVVYTTRGRTTIHKLGNNPVPLPQVTTDGVYRVQTDYKFHDNGVQGITRICTANGRYLDASAKHRWLIRRRDTNNRKPFVVYTEDLRVGDTVAVPDRWEAEEIGSSGWGKGLVLGAILGDGSLRDGVNFCGFDDFIPTLAEQASQEFGVDWSEYSVSDIGLRLGKFVRREGQFRNPLTSWFRQQGLCGSLSGDKFLPESVFTESLAFKRGIVCGMIETDGSVVRGQKPHISYDSTSRRLVEDFRDLLWQFGIHGTFRARPNKGKFSKPGSTIYSFRIKGQEDIYRFHQEFTLVAKQAALDDIVKASPVKRHGMGVNVPEGLRFTRIQSMERLGEADTYCLTLDGETFLANGLLSMNSIHPMAAATAGTLVKIGTPNRKRSEFFEACRRNKRTDLAEGVVRSKKRRHYEYDYTVCQKHNPRYRKYIKKEKARLGEDSDEFRMKYRLHWLLDRGMFVNPDLFEECGIHAANDVLSVEHGRGRRKTRHTFKRPPNVVTYDPVNEGIIAAIDVGRTNSTVVTVANVFWDNPIEYADSERYFVHILNWLELQGDDHEAQHPQIVDFLKNYRLSQAIVDATGKGDPVYSRLAHELSGYGVSVQPFIFNSTTKDVGYKTLSQEIHARRFTYPAGAQATRLQKWQRFVTQMEDLEKEWRGQQMVVHKPKHSSDARDDFCDSAMMVCWLANVGMQTEVEAAENPFLGRQARWHAADALKGAKAWYRNITEPYKATRKGKRGNWD